MSTEGKVSLSGSDNTSAGSSESTLTSNKAYEEQENMKKTDTSEKSKNATCNLSNNALSDAHESLVTQNNIPTVTADNNTSTEDNEAPNSDMTKATSVMKLCRSPVKMNDVIKEEIHKLLQEEESRNTKVENTEQSSKLLKIYSNFETGLLNLQNQSFARRHSSASPVSSNSLSATSSSAVFTPPSASKTMCKTSGVLEESDEDDDDDDDDNVSKELKILDAIVASKHEEELIAKKSRERMLKAYSVDKSNMAAFGGAKKSLIDYATTEMSPMVWHELIEERRKKWLLNHSLWK